MTVFAVMTAGLFPILHLGRPWKFFWLIPYPNWRLIWPNPKSPLVWDVFAILTYLTISSTFLYIGLIPDIAVLRDREKNPVRKRDLRRCSRSAGGTRIASGGTSRAPTCSSPRSPTPLVLSVHSVVSFDFAMALTPGWHATIFPPYFVAGAIFSGIGMVFTIIIPLRKCFKLEHYITLNDLDAAAKLCLFTSMVVGLAYLTEFQVAWMSGNRFEQDYFWNRVFGQWAWAAWIMLICNMVLPLSLFSQKLRRNTTLALHPVALHQPRHVVRALRHRRAVAVARVRAVAVGHATARPGSTTAFCSAASAGSSCGSCCSSSSCP